MAGDIDTREINSKTVGCDPVTIEKEAQQTEGINPERCVVTLVSAEPWTHKNNYKAQQATSRDANQQGFNYPTEQQ